MVPRGLRLRFGVVAGLLVLTGVVTDTVRPSESVTAVTSRLAGALEREDDAGLLILAGDVRVTDVLAAAVDGSGAQEQGPFRIGVDLVSISVSVSDHGHRFIGDLKRDDFVVTENGIPQELSFFARTGVPLALALLIDTSSSMQSTLDTAQEAAIGFVRHLSAADVATVVSFDSDVEIVQGFTNDAVALQDGIRRTRAHGSTSLYNAVYIALKELNKTIRQGDSRSPRRRAIVLLSDGDDTSSLVSFDEIIDLASRSDTIIYTIGLGRPDATLSRRKYEDGEVRATKTGATDWRSVVLSTAREGAGRRVSRHPGRALKPGPRWPTNRARSVGTESGGRFTCR